MGLPIITSPRTESQLRSALARIERAIADIVSSGTGGAGTSQTLVTDSATVAALDVVYASSSGGVSPARADSGTTARVAGIALATTTVGNPIVVQVDGVVSGFVGLTFNTIYYLSPTIAGAITATAPSTVGQYVQPVGYALSSSKLLLISYPRILL